MAKTEELKKENTNLIRECFFDTNVWTKTELSEQTGLSLAGTTNVLQDLLKTEEIEYIGDADSTGGRKSKKYRLNKDHEHLGLIVLKKEQKDVISAEIRNLFSEVCFSERRETDVCTLRDLDGVIAMIAQDPKVKTIVISIPGVCVNGVVDICDMHSLEGVDLSLHIKEQFNVDVIVENDVNVACIGLAQMVPDIAHLAFVYQPAQDYVGCGMIINHQLHNGFSHFAGELRYLPFYDHDEQDRLLKNDPKKLLKDQIMTVMSVVNPEVIGYCSDVFEDELVIDPSFDHQHLSELIRVRGFFETVSNGLVNIAMKHIKERGKENGKVH